MLADPGRVDPDPKFGRKKSDSDLSVKKPPNRIRPSPAVAIFLNTWFPLKMKRI